MIDETTWMDDCPPYPPEERVIELLVRFQRKNGCPPTRIAVGSAIWVSFDNQFHFNMAEQLARSRGIPYEPAIIGPGGRVPVHVVASLDPQQIKLIP